MKDLITLNNELKMSSREIAERTGKRHDHVKVDIVSMLTSLEADIPSFRGIYRDAMNREQTEYLLPKHEVICLVTGYRADLRMKVIKRLDELEAEQKNQLPNFTNPAEAAIAWAEQYKAKEIALAERDEAIRTKSWISTKQAQTAMTTASIAVRRAEKLANQLGEGKTYLQVKAIPWLNEFFNLKNKGMYIALGSFLSKLCNLHNIKTIEIPHSEHGSVKAYHINAINLLCEMLTKDKTILGKYRLDNIIPINENIKASGQLHAVR